MQVVKHLRYIAEYIIARVFLAFLNRFSINSSIAAAEKIADMWFALHFSRRRIAIDNILKSGITNNPATAREIARKSFRHFAILIVESLRSKMFLDENSWRKNVKLEIDPLVMSHLNNPKQGLIVISGHFGNWEIAAQVLSYFKPVAGITRQLDNPYTNKLMHSLKPRNKYRLIPKYEANPLRFLQILTNGEILALLNDQHARREDPLVPFFGIPAHTHITPALLHLTTKIPVCFGYCARIKPCNFVLHADPPIYYQQTGNKQNDIIAILQMLNHYLEEAIRKYPDQYLWAHRRWKKLRPLKATIPTKDESKV